MTFKNEVPDTALLLPTNNAAVERRANWVRSTQAFFILLVYCFCGWAGFSWLETVRGTQVYPAGSLHRVIVIAATTAVLAGVVALILLWRGRASLRMIGPQARLDIAPESSATVAGSKAFSSRVVAGLLLCSLLYAAMVVRYSMTYAHLAFPPFYDDVGYFRDALRRLFVFYDHGLWALIKDYYQTAPHSPTSSLLAGVGFALAGTHDWVPPMMNFVIILGFLLLARWFTFRLPPALRWPVYAFLLAWPYLFQAVVHCIPDLLCCAATAAGAWFIAVTPWTARPARQHYLAGGLFGLALFAKPAMFPATLVVLAGALFSAAAWHFAVAGIGRFARGFGVPTLRAVGAMLVISLPHYAVNWQFILAYIRINTFSSRSDLWKYQGNLSKQFLYYFTGDGGVYAMGPLRWIWVAVALLALLAAWRRRSFDAMRSAVGGAMVLATTHAVVSVTSYKTVFLGLTIPAFILISGLAMLTYALRVFWETPGVAGRLGLALCLATTAAAVVQFRFQPMVSILAHRFSEYPRHGPDFIREGEYRHKCVDDMLSVLRTDHRTVLRVGICGGDLYAAPLVFEYEGSKDRTRSVTFSDGPDFSNGDNDEFRRAASSVDYLGVFDQASPAAERRLLDRLQAVDNWEIVGRTPTPWNQGQFLILRRAGTWRSISLESPQEGFDHLEGPFAPDQFQVRWAHGPGMRIIFSAQDTSQVQLVMSAMTSSGNQTITVWLDGQKMATESLPISSDFKELRVPLTLSAGEHELKLEFSNWERAPDRRPLAVLFREFRITAAN